jgi:hypothetical protein
MSPKELFASIRERRRRSAQQSYEQGAQIRRRLQELLAVPSPAQQVEAPFTYVCNGERTSMPPKKSLLEPRFL